MSKTQLKKQELEQLLGVYNGVVSVLASFDHPSLQLIIEMWPAMEKRIRELVDGETSGVSPSTLIAGVKQGLLEIPRGFGSLPADMRSKVTKAYISVIEAELPAFFEKMDRDMRVVLERGRIKSEREFHLVQLMIERAEENRQTQVLEQLYGVINEYESR
ncbi:hypothetical protein JCM19000A_22800 [Silvimonas sp. JCM 19000]